MDPIIYIDMDDTIADFKTASRSRSQNATMHIEKLYPQSKVGFFKNLEPIPGAIEGVERLISKDYDVNFLTRPSIHNTHCYTEKAEWIKKYFGHDMLKNLYFSCDKSRLIGDYLIDDHISNNDFKGTFIQYGTKPFLDWKIVTDFIIYQEEEIIDNDFIRPMYNSKIEHLINTDNDHIRSLYKSWGKGDCSTVGLLKILLKQQIMFEETDFHYNGDYNDIKNFLDGK